MAQPQYQYPMPMPMPQEAPMMGAPQIPAMAPMPNIFAQFTRPLPSAPAVDGDSDGPCMSRKTLLSVALAVAIVLIIMIFYYMFSPRTLSKSLARCGWIVYYRQGCGFCTKQKQVLGGEFRKYIECDTSGNQLGGYTTSPPLPCNSRQITGFPFWYNTRTQDTRVGLQDTQALESMARR